MRIDSGYPKGTEGRACITATRHCTPGVGGQINREAESDCSDLEPASSSCCGRANPSAAPAASGTRRGAPIPGIYVSVSMGGPLLHCCDAGAGCKGGWQHCDSSGQSRDEAGGRPDASSEACAQLPRQHWTAGSFRVIELAEHVREIVVLWARAGCRPHFRHSTVAAGVVGAIMPASQRSRRPIRLQVGDEAPTSSVPYPKLLFLNPNYSRHSRRTTTKFWNQFKRDLVPISSTTSGLHLTGSSCDAGDFRPRCHFPQDRTNADRKPARRLQTRN